MTLRPGPMMQRRHIIRRRSHMEVGIEASGEERNPVIGLALFTSQNRREAQKLIYDGFGAVAADDDRDSPHRFLAPPKRAREIRAEDFRRGPQMPQQSLRFLGSVIEQYTLFALLDALNGCEDFCFGFLAEAFDLSHQSLRARRLEIGNAFDAESVMESDDFFQIETRNGTKFDRPWGQFVSQLPQRPTLACGMDFFYDRSQRAADASNIG